VHHIQDAGAVIIEKQDYLQLSGMGSFRWNCLCLKSEHSWYQL